ncbi:beta-galactosidase [Gracilibacillus caseinilyticus]|uniref:Beta-galactosidase n=1 Tax=Gracilibacillus caseinilyticus TaxID=2932256 RepID=A0ABY4ETE2_9BACI|nr:beta-galactosidase [Gracilibacillus caseinilyticus]UOQ47695.1 beta-galactosidase [Gracilibacillus caseinilyticus]
MVKAIEDVMPQIAFGGDYNPEQWDESVWLEDAKLMQEAGVNLVSVAIFSWSVIERKEGEFDFHWLDRVLDILHEHGVGVSLATATASPPAWLSKDYPEVLAVQANGVPYQIGSRQHYSPNSKRFRYAVKRLVTEMANRYKDHPALKMWHINNEYACHLAECYSQESLETFRDWLKNRYETIEQLNQKWGTNFWSQRYNDWDEIQFPVNLPTFYNPSQRLDYERFMNDAIFDLYKIEKEVLRDVTPEVPVFTNFMYEFKPLNYFEWAKEMDLVTWDSYPDPREGRPYRHAMHHDLMRSLKNGQPFYLMEQVTSHVNWRDINLTKKPGEMRLWSYSTVARGGDGVMYFQWRQGRAGAEKFHGAMVQHSNDPNSRVYQEVKQLGQELKQLDGLAGARGTARVAIIFDWENWWAVEHEGKPHNKLSYLDQVYSYYQVCYEQNIAVDFVETTSDLSTYQVIVAPMLYMIRNGEEKHLEEFVKNGGTLIVSFFSGIVDEQDHIHLGGYPAPLRNLLGMTVEEFAPMADDETNRIVANGEITTVDTWADIIRLEGAKAVAHFKDNWYKGKPAVTIHRYGKGKSVYIGTNLASECLASLLAGIFQQSDIKAPLDAPENVEIVERKKNEKTFLFILNYNEDPVTISLEPNKLYENCLQKTDVSDEITVSGTDVAVIRF